MSGGSTYLGFDFGTHRIGVAVGESVTSRARPLTTLNAQDGQPNWAQIESLLQEWRPTALIVGLPRRLNGTDAPITSHATRFARRLQGRFQLPVHLIDEQLSSHAAEQTLAERGHYGKRRSPRKQNRADVDQVAAAIILETWLAEQIHD